VGREANLRPPGGQRAAETSQAAGTLTATAYLERTGAVLVDVRDPSGGGQVTFAGLDEVVGDADFLVPLTLVPAMAQRLDLALPGIASPMLRSQIPSLQRIFARWYPAMRVAEIKATSRAPEPAALPRGRGHAAFFSGGVDSFYTALALRDRLDALVFVTGFDFGIGRADEPDARHIAELVRAAAARLGLPLVHVSTSLRAYSDRHVLWGDHYVGSALAAVALLLAPRFRSLTVPATHQARSDFPYGTHLRTDPLWSTERMRIRQHGAGVSRPYKVARISSCAAVMDTLRVCWENRGGRYNCGTCEKCLRTMAELYLAGALERCRTLPDRIDIDALSRLPVSDPSRRSFAVSLLNSARASRRPLGGSIAGALRQALRERRG
jgi:hypothetical protein